MFIYVLDIHGKPLMPTQRAGKIRRMLREGKARIAGHAPFTIQLLYQTTSYTQPVTLGLDPGSKVAGLSCSTDKNELLRMEIQLRSDIVELISSRREARRTRRCKRSVRYRAPRFDNRRKREGWLAPSVRQRVGSHLALIRKACALLPVSRIIVETAQFDMQRINNPGIAGEQYQHGQQEGWKNVREYVLWRDGHKCRCCAGKSKDTVLEVHHLESRKTGGDSPSNLVTLCRSCHDAYHAGTTELNLKRSAPSLRDATAVNIYRWRIYDELVKAYGKHKIRLIYGYTTKDRRIGLRLPKTSETDAFCIAGNLAATRSSTLWQLRCLRRHNRKVMKSNQLSGGRWKRNQAPREIRGFRLWDLVTYNNTPAYVHGRRSSGFFVIKDAGGRTVSNSVSYKKLELIRHCNTHLAFATPGGALSIPPPSEDGGILETLS